ncbi:MAG: prolipoprotein diacylglyceryl transferase [Ruminococcus sp.]|nr:prolipoprotein diacylglyceryl transferase [Ruminococcus sp.]
MLPEIVIFGASINLYALCIAIGLIAMCVVAVILGKKSEISIEDIIFGELFILIGAFIGSHLLYGITYIPDIVKTLGTYFEEGWDTHYFFDIIFFYMSGMVYYGGLILGIVFAVLYCKMRKLEFKKFSDCFAVGLPLFLAITRIGCFLAGYSYGVKSSLGIADSEGITRFPVQLVECFVCIVIFALMILLVKKGKFKGQLLYFYLLTYACARFFIDFFRGDESRGFFLFLSTSQWISLILICVSVYKLFAQKQKKTEIDEEKV